MSEHDDSSPPEPYEMPLVQPASQPVGPALALVALILPLIAGVAHCFVTTWPVSLAIALTTVILTATLLTIDAFRLGVIDRKGNRREHPILLFVAMVAIWILGYPVTYFRRGYFAGPPLGLLSIVVALFFIGAPLARALLAPAELPSCTNPQVTELVDRLIRGAPIGPSVKSIGDYREVRIDPETKQRYGECKARTATDELTVQYVVEWMNRDKREIRVRTLPPEIPACASPMVMRLLEQSIRQSPTWAGVKSISDHRELSFDANAQRRVGHCILHVDGAEIAGKYEVEFQNRDQGLVLVRFLPEDPPLCTSKGVTELVERLVRQSAAGPSVKSLADFRELRYDREANRRHGQCTVHTTTGDVMLKFVVEFKDKAESQVIVRLVSE